MKDPAIRTIKEEIAALSKEQKRSHKILVKDFVEVLGLRKETCELIALNIIKSKRKL